MEKVIKSLLIPIVGFVIMMGCACCTSKDQQEQKKQMQIERALSDRDFEKAREIAASLEWKGGIFTKIDKAQISYMVSSGEIQNAEELSRELDCSYIFWKEVNKNVRPLYESDFRSLYMLLSNFPFTASYHSQLKKYYVYNLERAQEYAISSRTGSLWKEEFYSSNVGYNDEATMFNNIILKIIDLAIFDDKTADLKKLIPLLKPEAVEIRRKKVDKDHEYYDIDYKLENRAKQQALEKIKETGIRL